MSLFAKRNFSPVLFLEGFFCFVCWVGLLFGGFLTLTHNRLKRWLRKVKTVFCTQSWTCFSGSHNLLRPPGPQLATSQSACLSWNSVKNVLCWTGTNLLPLCKCVVSLKHSCFLLFERDFSTDRSANKMPWEQKENKNCSGRMLCCWQVIFLRKVLA